MFAKAADVKAPTGNGLTNTDVLSFTLGLASLVAAVPAGWEGQFVRIRPIGGDMWFYFSMAVNGATEAQAAAATAADPAAAADGGPGATRGEYVPNGELFHCVIPSAKEGAGVYFVRIGGTASTKVQMAKASGMPGNNLEQGK